MGEGVVEAAQSAEAGRESASLKSDEFWLAREVQEGPAWVVVGRGKGSRGGG